VNRLRHDDLIRMFESAGHRILRVDLERRQDLLRMLESGALELSGAFRKKPYEVLSITASWIVSRKRG